MTKIDFREIDQLSEDDLTRITQATPNNYQKIIWDSIVAYNHKAQLDIAEILHSHLQQVTAIDQVKNLTFRIFQLFFEEMDQLALICLMVVDGGSRNTYEVYVGAENTTMRTFWRMIWKNQINDTNLIKILGIENIHIDTIKNDKDRQKVISIIEESISNFKSILNNLAEAYVDTDSSGDKPPYSHSVKGNFAVKHGYKMVAPSNLAKQIWHFEDHDAVVMEELVDVKIKSSDKQIRMVRTGSISKDIIDEQNLDIMMKNIRNVSQLIYQISLVQRGKMDDPHYAIKLLAENGLMKVGVNDPCPCGSQRKFKKCHGR